MESDEVHPTAEEKKSWTLRCVCVDLVWRFMASG